MEDINLIGEEELKSSISGILSNSDPRDWLIIGHNEGKLNELVLVAEGTTGFKGMLEVLEDGKPQYVFIRMNPRLALGDTIKFVRIYLIPEETSPVDKARLTLVYSVLRNLLDPFHVEFIVSTKDALDEDAVNVRISATAGTSMNYQKPNETGDSNNGELRYQKKDLFMGAQSLSAYRRVTPTQKDPHSFIPSSRSKELSVEVGERLLEFINEIKYGSSGKNWLISEYRPGEKSGTVTFVTSGKGGAEDVKVYLTKERIYQVLIRYMHETDGNPIPKFVHIQWVGSDVPAMKKAKYCVQAASVAQLFHPLHLNITASAHDEVSDAIIQKKLAQQTGGGMLVV